MNEIAIAIIGSGALSALISNIFTMVQMSKKKQTGERKALQILLSDNIKRKAEEYLSNGEISTDDLQDLLRSWECYHNDLDGNGYLDNVVAAVKRLPLKVKE